MHIPSKKITISIFVGVSLLVSLALILPLQSNVKETIRLSANNDALFRQLMQDSTWEKWWPGKTVEVNSKAILVQDDIEFSVHRILYNTIEFKTNSNSYEFNSILEIMAEPSNELTLTLATSVPIPHDPINRIKALVFASKLKRAFHTILANLTEHYKNPKNLYDLEIKEVSVPFEYVATVSQNCTHKPTLSEIYALISQVKKYIKSNGGIEKGYPMLNSTRLNANDFFLQVAIPIDKRLPESKNIKSKWMLKGGNIISAQVTGNRKAIENVKKKIELYIQDNHKNTVAIPYEYLITNRLEQPDSNKWVTQIYFPVI